jgi:hypothetical protein
VEWIKNFLDPDKKEGKQPVSVLIDEFVGDVKQALRP